MRKFAIAVMLFALFVFMVLSIGGSASANTIPELVYLGEGPGTFETPLDNFIVKIRPFDFKFVSGPIYEAAAGERVWGSRGTNQAPPAEWEVTEDLGKVEAGCIAKYVGIDDDVDGRINEFRLDGEVIEIVVQGLVFSGSFVIPRDGNLVFVARDSVGGYFFPCDEREEPTPTQTATATSTATPEPSPTPTETPAPTDTATPGPSPTPTETPAPTGTAAPGPSPTATMIAPTPEPTRRPRELSCVRINFDVGGHEAAEGLYIVQETGGKLLVSWYAQEGWKDSGWFEGIDISHENVYVQVLYYSAPDSEPIVMKILNPAPGTPYGWMSWGICHAIEVAWPDGMEKPAGAMVPWPEEPAPQGGGSKSVAVPPPPPADVVPPTAESQSKPTGATLNN